VPLHLTDQERAWLSGDASPALRRAMEIVAALAEIYGAERLIPVGSVQISGVSYRNLGAAGLDFLRRWADEGARVRVPTTLNPAAMDLRDWRAQGIAPDFAAKQQAVIDAFARMGVSGGSPTPTCTPYLIGNRPAPGTSVAWAESSAVSYANSVLGAHTNREGGPGAIAAALTGRTGAYGLHQPENRRVTLRVAVAQQPRTLADYSALGALVGQAARQGVPYVEGLSGAGDPLWPEKCKALGAAMAALGAVALYYVAGASPTPEAPPGPDVPRLDVDDLASGYALLNDDVARVDLVWVGCPHASLAEIARVAAALHGKRLRVPLWITCARPVKDAAVAQGLAAPIEAAGGRLFADACMAIAPVREMGFRAVATPSAKGAYYLRNLAGVKVRFAGLAQCVATATGETR
jgi:hypothetical protein